MRNKMIFYGEKHYSSFEEILEEKLDDFDTLKPEDFIIEYLECELEPCIKWNIESIVEGLIEERDTEDDDYFETVVALIRSATNEQEIAEKMPRLYYPVGKDKTFDLRELDDYKEFLKESEVSDD